MRHPNPLRRPQGPRERFVHKQLIIQPGQTAEDVQDNTGVPAHKVRSLARLAQKLDQHFSTVSADDAWAIDTTDFDKLCQQCIGKEFSR